MKVPLLQPAILVIKLGNSTGVTLEWASLFMPA